jgi:hypothetical protein
MGLMDGFGCDAPTIVDPYPGEWWDEEYDVEDAGGEG